MAKVKWPHVVFSSHESIMTNWRDGSKRRIKYGVYIDLEELAHLAADAERNKSRHAKDGPLHVEFHSVEKL